MAKKSCAKVLLQYKQAWPVLLCLMWQLNVMLCLILLNCKKSDYLWICVNDRDAAHGACLCCSSSCIFWMFLVWFLIYGEAKGEKAGVPAAKVFCEMQFSPTALFKWNNWIQCFFNCLVTCLRITFVVISRLGLCSVEIDDMDWLEESVFTVQKCILYYL